MIILTKEAVIIKAQARLENIRGISVSENWHNSRPVTLSMLIEEAIEAHPEIMWLGDDLPEEPPAVRHIQPERESDRIEQESAQDEQESVRNVQESAQDEQESVQERHEEAAAGADHEKAKAPTDLGRWAEYQGRALSNDDINFVIKGMVAEGYTYARISTVVRLTPPAVSARARKVSKEAAHE